MNSPRADDARPVAYISGPLQAAEDLAEARAFYERQAETCRECGWKPYLPHQQTDPIHHAEATATSVFGRDLSAVLAAELIIAYVGAPSSGVGAELGIAYEREIPIIGLCGPEGVASRFIEGLLVDTGSATLIRYRDSDDCQRQLTDELTAFRERLEAPLNSQPSPQSRMRRLPHAGASPAPS